MSDVTRPPHPAAHRRPAPSPPTEMPASTVTDRPALTEPAPGHPGQSLLAEIVAGLRSGSDLGVLLDRLLGPVVRLTGARAGTVRVLSDDGASLHLVSGLGPAVAACSRVPTVDRGCGYCGQAARGPQLVWAADTRACGPAAAGLAAGAAPRRMLAVPLHHRGRVLGIYNLFFDDDKCPAPDVEALLASVGELIGLALDNARLESENLQAMVLHERQTMAAEVHDSMAQTLTFVKMRLPLLQDALRTHDEPRAQGFLDDVRQAVGEAHASLREIVTQFRTRTDPRGLQRALDELAWRFRQRTGIALQLDNRAGALHLPLPAEAEVFHVVQEALANVERHSGAHRAWVRLEHRADGLHVCIEDDGRGPAAPQDGQAHHGIEIMRERAHRLGGTLSVTPRSPNGTHVCLELPLPDAASALLPAKPLP